MRRTLMLTALLVTLGWASGYADDFGMTVKKVTFPPVNLDTNQYLDGAAAKINDSISIYSSPFSVEGSWTRCLMRLVQGASDTLMTHDTISVVLQSKTDSPYDTLWWTIATIAKKAEGTIMSAPATSNARAYNDADSIGVGDLFRIKLIVAAAQDSNRIHAVAGGGFLKRSAIYQVYLLFQNRGNE